MYLASVMDGRSLWNDKSLNLIVFANGKCCMNGEHSASDAPVPSRMLRDMAEWVVENPRIEGRALLGVVQRLDTFSPEDLDRLF